METEMDDSDKPVDRETLYNEVWAEPVTVVALRYGLSDVGLAKICRAMAIPLPSRGYWAKVKAGRVMNKPPLPKIKAKNAAVAGPIRLPPEKVQARETAKKSVARIKKEIAPSSPSEAVPATTHPLVRIASTRLHQRNGWPENTLLRSAPKEVLNLSITKESIDRALGIVDSLLKELAKQGLEAEVKREQGITVLHSREMDISFEFAVTEQVRRTRHEVTAAEEQARKRYWERPYLGRSMSYPDIPQYDYTATGDLTIQVGHGLTRKWNDTARTRLEQRLSEVISGIVAFAHETQIQKLEQARREAARRKASERFAYLTKRRSDEVERFKQLETSAANWERAVRLRMFADKVEAEALQAGGLSPSQVEWLAWARAKADWLDPLIQVSDPILDAPEPTRPGYW